jgi:hypothetical protein
MRKKKRHTSRTILSHETKDCPKASGDRTCHDNVLPKPNQAQPFRVLCMQTPGSAHPWLGDTFLVVNRYSITYSCEHESGYAYFAPRIRPKISHPEVQEGGTNSRYNQHQTSTRHLDQIGIEMERLLIEYGGLDFNRWRHDLKEHRKASGGGQRLCTVVLKDVELDGGGRGKRGVVPAQRLVARDFAERIAYEPEEDDFRKRIF